MDAIWMRWSNITTFKRSFLVAPTGVEIFRAVLRPCPPEIDMLEGKEAVPCAFRGGVVMRSSQRYISTISYGTIDPINAKTTRPGKVQSLGITFTGSLLLPKDLDAAKGFVVHQQQHWTSWVHKTFSFECICRSLPKPFLKVRCRCWHRLCMGYLQLKQRI